MHRRARYEHEDQERRAERYECDIAPGAFGKRIQRRFVSEPLDVLPEDGEIGEAQSDDQEQHAASLS